MRKRRTRSHIIADLSANHVERYILRGGHTVERVVHDYGVDMTLTTFDANGEIENGLITLQLKATDHLALREDGETMGLVISTRDVERWVKEPLPVLLILYDASEEVAYWLYVQAYFAQQPRLLQGETITVSVSRQNRIDDEAIARFVRFKAHALSQMRGIIHYATDDRALS